MKKTLIATLMAGTMVLGMTACGTKPAETTVAPTTVEETTVETTAETTPAETTTAETTVEEPEYPAVGFTDNDKIISNVQATNITYRLVDGEEFTGDSFFAGQMIPVYEAQANQDITITFTCDKALVIRNLDTSQVSDIVRDGCTLTKEGNTYTLTIPANTFSAGDTCFLIIMTDDAEWDAEGTMISGSVISTSFPII